MHACMLASKKRTASALMGGGGGGLGLLQRLLGLLLLLLLLLLLPSTGRKLLLQGVHLALKQVLVLLRHPLRLHGHMGLASRDLKLPTQRFQLLVTLLRLMLLLHPMGDVGV